MSIFLRLRWGWRVLSAWRQSLVISPPIGTHPDCIFSALRDMLTKKLPRSTHSMSKTSNQRTTTLTTAVILSSTVYISKVKCLWQSSMGGRSSEVRTFRSSLRFLTQTSQNVYGGFNFDLNCNFSCGRLSSVSYTDAIRAIDTTWGSAMEPNSLNCNISPDLRLPDLARYLVRVAPLLDRLQQGNEAKPAYQQLRPADDTGPKDPISRLPLGCKIALIAFGFAFGFYNLADAFGLLRRSPNATFPLNVFAGVAGIWFACFMLALLVTP